MTRLISGYARFRPFSYSPLTDFYWPFSGDYCSIVEDFDLQRRNLKARDNANRKFTEIAERLERMEKILSPPAEEEAESSSEQEEEKP